MYVSLSSFQDIDVIKKSKTTNDMSSVDGKLRELSETLTKIRQESEDQIQKLRQESQDASKTIEKLQERLKQQSDYEMLKREIQ